MLVVRARSDWDALNRELKWKAEPNRVNKLVVDEAL